MTPGAGSEAPSGAVADGGAGGRPTPAPGYPLSALVGQDDLVEALMVCAVSPAASGVLVRGERGTAKSTAVRALAPMLGEGAPLVDVPLGTTLDRLLGSLDVRAAFGGEHRVERGLLAKADGGVLYVDEVNLLGDHLVDALLDAAATGRVVVERDGASVVEASRFLLVGTMNPEEGELRPQLLDRFGLGVEVAGPRDPAVRAEIVERRMAYDADPAAFVAAWAEAERDVAARLAAARELLPSVVLPSRMLRRITSVCAKLDLDGVRGDLVCAHASRAVAALAGEREVTAEHVERACHLALRHRLRRDPLAPPPGPGGDPALDEALQHAADEEPGEGSDGGSGSDGPSGAEASADGDAGDAGDDAAGDGLGGDEAGGPDDGRGGRDPRGDGRGGWDRDGRDGPRLGGDRDGDDGTGDGQDGSGADGGEPQRPRWAPDPDLAPTAGQQRAGDGAVRERRVAVAAPEPSRIPADALSMRGRSARRAERGRSGAADLAPAPAGRARGGQLAVVDARPARPEEQIAVLPTLLARLRGDDTPRAAITGGGRATDLVLIVDASGSMAARRRLGRVKGAVEATLRLAYARRDRVSVVAFSGDGARTLVAPGTPLEQAAAQLSQLPAGGRTPLAEGLEHALALLDPSASTRHQRPADGQHRRPAGVERQNSVAGTAEKRRSTPEPAPESAGAERERPAHGQRPAGVERQNSVAGTAEKRRSTPEPESAGAERQNSVAETAQNRRSAPTASLRDGGRARLVLLLTDGRAADRGGRAARALEQISRRADRTVVVDLEDGRARLGLAAELARAAGADLTRLVTPDQATPSRSAA